MVRVGRVGGVRKHTFPGRARVGMTPVAMEIHVMEFML